MLTKWFSILLERINLDLGLLRVRDFFGFFVMFAPLFENSQKGSDQSVRIEIDTI